MHGICQTPLQIWESPKVQQRALQPQQLLAGSIDLGKSISIAFFQFESLSLASGSSFSSAGSITSFCFDAEPVMPFWSRGVGALLEQIGSDGSLCCRILSPGGPAVGILGSTAEMHCHGLVFARRKKNKHIKVPPKWSRCKPWKSKTRPTNQLLKETKLSLLLLDISHPSSPFTPHLWTPHKTLLCF